MGIARIAGDFWTHPKRAKLELATRDGWGRFPVPMCAGEACARILAWLDDRDDPSGSIPGPEELELVAGWQGTPGQLCEALIDSRLVDRGEDGTLWWHNFGRLNGKTIRRRNSRRAKQGDTAGDKKGDNPGDEKAGSGSGSSTRLKAQASGSSVSDSSETASPQNPRPPRASRSAGREGLKGPIDGTDALKLWNDNCPPLPRATTLNGRETRLRAFRKAAGDDAAAAIRAAAADVFYRQKRHGIDTFLRHWQRFVDEARAPKRKVWTPDDA